MPGNSENKHNGKLETIWYDLGESGAMPFEDRTNGINDVWSLYRQGHGIARIFNLELQISKDRTVFSMLVFFVISEFYVFKYSEKRLIGFTRLSEGSVIQKTKDSEPLSVVLQQTG